MKKESDLAKFMRSSGPEKEKVMLEVARRANEQQRNTLTLTDLATEVKKRLGKK